MLNFGGVYPRSFLKQRKSKRCLYCMRSCFAFLVVNLAANSCASWSCPACHGWSFCIWSLMILRTTSNGKTLLNKHFTSPTKKLISEYLVDIESSKPRSLTNRSYIPQSFFQDPNGPVTVDSYVSTRSKGSPYDTAWILPQPHRLRLWVKWAMARPNLRWLMKHQRKKSVTWFDPKL